MSKKNLNSLQLCWALWPESRLQLSSNLLELRWGLGSDSRPQLQQNVIDSFQPHSNLKRLVIHYYPGVLTPSWLTASLVPNLVQISLSQCTIEHLGPLRKLDRLKILKLHCMYSLKFIEEELMDDASAEGRGFPSLEVLILWELRDLEGWLSQSQSQSQAAATITQEVAVFPCLKKVLLHDCPKLKGGIPLAWSPLQHVYIDGSSCNGMVLASLRDLPSLPSLRISWFAELEYFPSGTLTNLTALHKLEIYDCPCLKALPVELYSLATLTELEIWSCDNLKTLPVELNSLATLTELNIRSCHNLVSLAEEREGGLKILSSLKTLIIERCEALKCLPELDKASLVNLKIINCPGMEFSKEDFEHLVVLESLQLVGLPKLTCFPEGIKKHSAATLGYLRFQPCSKYGAAVDLPDWIGTTSTSLEYLAIDAPKNWNVLPQWMQHLTALVELQIDGCNKGLAERWWNRHEQREAAYCFNMISHVRYIILNPSG